jgi:hypothetical protein
MGVILATLALVRLRAINLLTPPGRRLVYLRQRFAL